MLTVQVQGQDKVSKGKYLAEARVYYEQKAYMHTLDRLKHYHEAKGPVNGETEYMRISCYFELHNLHACQAEIETFKSLKRRHKHKYRHNVEILESRVNQLLQEYENYIDQGSQLSNIGEYEAATRLFDAAISLDSFNASDYYDRGLAREMAGDHYGAVADLGRSIHEGFASPQAFYLHGMASYTIRDTNGAIRDFNKAIALDSNMEQPYVYKAIISIGRKDFNAAARDLKKATQLNKRDEMAYFYIAYMNQLQGNFKTSLENYNKVASLDGNYENLYYNRGNVKYELCDYDGAIADFSRHIILNPKDDMCYNRRATALVQRAYTNDEQDNLKAITDYNKAIALNPNEVRYYRNRAFSYMELNNYKKAVLDYLRVLERDSSNAEDFISLANAKNLAYDKKGAILILDRAIRLFPRSGKAYYFRGLTKKELGMHQEGNADIRISKKIGWTEGSFLPY